MTHDLKTTDTTGNKHTYFLTKGVKKHNSSGSANKTDKATVNHSKAPVRLSSAIILELFS